MNISPEKYIEERVIGQKDYYSGKSATMQKRYKMWQIIKIVCALLIPIITVIDATLKSQAAEAAAEGATACAECDYNGLIFPVIIAILGGIVVLVEGIQKLYDYKDLWRKYRVTAEALKRESWYYNTGSGPYKNENEPFNLLVERCEALISDENTAWETTIEKDDES